MSRPHLEPLLHSKLVQPGFVLCALIIRQIYHHAASFSVFLVLEFLLLHLDFVLILHLTLNLHLGLARSLRAALLGKILTLWSAQKKKSVATSENVIRVLVAGPLVATTRSLKEGVFNFPGCTARLNLLLLHLLLLLHYDCGLQVNIGSHGALHWSVNALYAEQHGAGQHSNWL